MIKNKNPKDLYCAVVGCHSKAIGMTQFTESRTGAKFVSPICDFHTTKKARINQRSRESELENIKAQTKFLWDRIDKLDKKSEYSNETT